METRDRNNLPDDVHSAFEKAIEALRALGEPGLRTSTRIWLTMLTVDVRGSRQSLPPKLPKALTRPPH